MKKPSAKQPKPAKVKDFNAATSTRSEEKKKDLKSIKKSGVIAPGAPGFARF